MHIEVTLLENDKKQLEAKLNDAVRLCQKHASAKFTSFLTEEEQREIKDFLVYGFNIAYFGGYDDAKRRMFGVFPEWQETDFSEFPIKIIHLKKKYEKTLTHRDYLGTVLSLGIERNKIGDILVDDAGAYIFLHEHVSDVVLREVEKVNNCGVKASFVELQNIELPKQEYDDLFCIAASMRLDAIVSGVTKLSRSKAVNLIMAGKVSLNHAVTENTSAGVLEGDVLSIRGFGRYIVFSQGGRTGSGRLHVHIKKFR